MAQVTNAYDAYEAGSASLTGLSNREDLSDIIYNIAPTETPFLMLAGRGTARNAKHEWLTDTLTAAASNYQLEGETYAGTAVVPPARLHTFTQITARAVTITGTQESIDKAGRQREMAYQLSLRSKELKRDMERHAVGFATSGDASALGGGVAEGSTFPNTLGTVTAARTTGNVGSWVFTNVDGPADDTVIGTTTGQIDVGDSHEPGTARAILESMLKTGIRQAWNAGGNPGTILVDAFNKQAISAFTGGATRFDRSEDKKLVTAVDVYVSDFGDHTVVPDRFIVQPLSGGGTSCYILDMMYWSIDYLRPFQQTPLAKTGDAETRLLLVEWSICAKNEAASAQIFDITAS
jgi:hypothetical protein